ncbi:MAG TPA: aminoglycoside phosphotransferase family protein [Bauldia sp.]|nr:aminoglycoside phosphotransferase family protein [Bauldia sp.]
MGPADDGIDAGTRAILAGFGIAPDALIGEGGTSLVFALEGNRVIRILRRRGDPAALRQLAGFLAMIDGRVACPTPRIERVDPEGRFVIEGRLAGRALLRVLPGLAGVRRERAFAAYARSAEAVATVTFPERAFGQILAAAPLTAPTWRGYLRAALDRFAARNAAVIAASAGDVEGLVARARTLLDAVPEPRARFLVHGDYFPGNVLVDDSLSVTGLVDFSDWTVVGDPALDIAGAALFLEMIDEATPGDVARVRDIVFSRHGPAIVPAARFYRAYAAFAVADPEAGGGLYPKMFRWAVATLKALGEGTIEA